MNAVLASFRALSFRRKIGWSVAVVLLIQGFYLSYIRFFKGLGAVTNLSDLFPWGFWIGFDVISGVALASGGFTLCFLVYVFGYHRYHSIVRPTVLTAFLGYILVAIGLIYDLGRYYNIWHPIIMWNPHSVMFEVAWCVILYTTVLFLEFLPVVLEKFQLKGPLRLMQRITIPLIIAGVILSTLHQSSLGSVFLIVPEKLHPLWYSQILPLLFFMSAVMVGPAMVIVESYVSAQMFRRGLELPILVDLAGFLLVAAIVYTGVRIQDLFVRGIAHEILSGSFESFHFIFEITIIIVAIGILSIRKLRVHRFWMPFASVLVVLGVIYNRINVAWTGMIRNSNTSYFPSYGEIGITLFLLTIGTLAFYFIAKYFPIFPKLQNNAKV